MADGMASPDGVEEDEIVFRSFDDYSGGRSLDAYRRKYPDDPVELEDFPMTWGRFLGL